MTAVNDSLERTVALLRDLISTPSLSGDEKGTADIIESHLAALGHSPLRLHNNIIVPPRTRHADRPLLMLNSHHDTVKPSPAYSFDPFTPVEKDGCIYGLGANDAGASVVSLIETFHKLHDAPGSVDLMLVISASEENMGPEGMRAVIPFLASAGLTPDMAIIGEPTDMQPAVGERGLLVLDCTAHGVTGHAARNEGVNAIYKAMADIDRLRNMKFERVSPLLGPIRISVTQIQAGRQHNVVPETCTFVADVRTTDAYSNIETLNIIKKALDCDVNERSTRVHASAIPDSHPLVKAAVATGGTPFVSPTTSDMALMPDFPTLKIGPGQSCRSHSADEFVRISEIETALTLYPQIIKSL